MNREDARRPSALSGDPGWPERAVDGRRCDRRAAGCNGYLVDPLDHIARGVESRGAGLMVAVSQQVALFVVRCTCGELGMDLHPQGAVERIAGRFGVAMADCHSAFP